MTDAVSTDTPPAASAAEKTPFSAGYTRYAMWLLLGIYIINFLDRQVINILPSRSRRIFIWRTGSSV